MEADPIQNSEEKCELIPTIVEKLNTFNRVSFTNKTEILDFCIATISLISNSSDPILQIQWNYNDWLSSSNPRVIEKALKFLNIYVRKID